MLNQNLDLYRRLVSILLDDNTAWGSGMWYTVNAGSQWSTPLKRPKVKQVRKETSMLKNAQNDMRLNPKEFEIDGQTDAGEEGVLSCRRLIEKWTPQLENEMLEAFIRLYYDEMFGEWGPDDEEESKEYWPEIETPGDLLKYTGTDVTLYALEDAIYARSKTGPFPYESQHVALCVILLLNCPWDEEHGWAAVFVDEKLVKVGRDIVDCVWLD